MSLRVSNRGVRNTRNALERELHRPEASARKRRERQGVAGGGPGGLQGGVENESASVFSTPRHVSSLEIMPQEHETRTLVFEGASKPTTEKWQHNYMLDGLQLLLSLQPLMK